MNRFEGLSVEFRGSYVFPFKRVWQAKLLIKTYA